MASKTAAPTLIQVPDRFSIVEPGVYRSASPTGAQVAFLQSLNLRTVISLTPEHPVRELVAYVRAAGAEFVHLGNALFQPLTDWRPISDEIVKTALELILDVRSHPVLVIDPLGIHQCGIVFGCLRVMQGWNFASALSEYRAHSGPSQHRYCDETYIELFDPDLVNLPPSQDLPAWWPAGDDEYDDDDGWIEQDPKPKDKKKKKKKDKEGDKEGGGEKDKEEVELPQESGAEGISNGDGGGRGDGTDGAKQNGVSAPADAADAADAATNPQVVPAI